MAMGTSLVALAMMAAGDAPAARDGAPITYQAKVLTIEGTGWRSESFHRMRPVARQGTSTIWTADRALADSLAKAAKDSTASPKVQASDGSTVAQKRVRSFRTHLERVADGPINQASRVAYIPERSSFSEGFQATVGGRRIDQGVLATVAIEDTHVVRVETVGLPEMIKAEPEAFDRGPIGVAQRVIRTVVNGQSETPATSIRGQIQVPEVATGRAEGEWLVPNDSVLLVSFGIHTTADAKGMAVTRERLAIVDFDAAPIAPISTESFGPVSFGGDASTLPPTPFVAGEPMPIALANLPQATPPSRSLPATIDVDGKEIELPPLPEAVASTDLNQIEPGSKLASPQMRVPGPMADAALARTGFFEPPPSTVPIMGESARTPLHDFARRLIERMGEYEMDIDLSGDGRTCRIALHESNGERAEADPACPPEPRRDNGKGMDAAVIASAFLEGLDPSGMKVGESFDFDIVPGKGPMAPLLKLLLSASNPPATLAPPKPRCPATAAEPCCPASEEAKARSGDPEATRGKSLTFHLRSALKDPGTTETTILPLSDKLSLEIKATVVPTPAATAKDDRATERVPFVSGRVEELLRAADALGRAANDWEPFWFLDHPSQMTPFRIEGGSKP